MITTMMNEKQGLAYTISCPAMDIPVRQTTLLKIWSKLNSSGPGNGQEAPGQVYYWGPFFILKNLPLTIYYIIHPKVDKSTRGQMDNSCNHTIYL